MFIPTLEDDQPPYLIPVVSSEVSMHPEVSGSHRESTSNPMITPEKDVVACFGDRVLQGRIKRVRFSSPVTYASPATTHAPQPTPSTSSSTNRTTQQQGNKENGNAQKRRSCELGDGKSAVTLPSGKRANMLRVPAAIVNHGDVHNEKVVAADRPVKAPNQKNPAATTIDKDHSRNGMFSVQAGEGAGDDMDDDSEDGFSSLWRDGSFAISSNLRPQNAHVYMPIVRDLTLQQQFDECSSSDSDEEDGAEWLFGPVLR